MTPADKGLQIPERESAPVVEDPAIVAGKEAKEAAAAWAAYAKAHPTLADEQTPEYKAIKERSERADQDFSAAPVTSLAGALVKLRALGKDITEDSGPEGWQQGHVKTVAAYLEGVECMPSVVGDDPAVAAFAELKAAWTAFKALPVDVEEQIDEAAYTRVAVARDAVRDAVPISQEGVAGKVRALLEPYRADPEAGGFDHDHDISAKAMLPFLEGAPAPAPKPDPVVTLFAKWAIIRDEATALGDADPRAEDPEINTRLEDAWRRTDALEDQIMDTPATSMRGVAIKIRIASHYAFDTGDLDQRYATPARDIDYVEATGGRLDAEGACVISALRDAERLAGVS